MVFDPQDNKNGRKKTYITPQDKVKKLEEDIRNLGFQVKETEEGEIKIEQ